jgi:hypothetical protein
MPTRCGTVSLVSTLTPAKIAHREARRMALVLREVGGEGAAIGEGWMACDVPGSWADYTAGLGVKQPVDEGIRDRKH